MNTCLYVGKTVRGLIDNIVAWLTNSIMYYIKPAWDQIKDLDENVVDKLKLISCDFKKKYPTAADKCS